MYKNHCLLLLLVLSSAMKIYAMYGDEEQQIALPCFTSKKMAMECFLRKSITHMNTRTKKRKKNKHTWSIKKYCTDLCELVLSCGCHCLVYEDAED